MADAVSPASPPAHTGNRLARVISFFLAGLLLLAVLGYGALRWLESDDGRAFVVRQLPLYQPLSGLRYRVGRVDGSLFGQARLHDLAVSDHKGLLATIPVLDLDWRPLDLITKTFTARSITAPEVRLLRRPDLLPDGDDRILPDFDFAIGRFRIDRLILETPVAGRRQVLGVGGNADIRAGRVLARLAALTLADSARKGSGDSIKLMVDAEPDADRFDMAADIVAPADGAIVALLGQQAPLTVKLGGDGRWKAWNGRLDARLGGAPMADLAITANSGLFTLKGAAMPGLIVDGLPARLFGPRLAIDASADGKDGKTTIIASIASPALSLTAQGRIDIGGEAIETMAINGQLKAPAALHPRIRGRDIRLAAIASGSFAHPLVDYRLTSAFAAWGDFVAEGLAASGRIDAGARPWLIPVAATARRVTGVAPAAQPLLTNVRVAGPLSFADGRLSSNAITFQTDRVSGRATLVAVPATADYVLTTTANIPRFALDGLGLADIGADLRIVPAPVGARVTGRVTAVTRQLTNTGINAITHGLPTLAADIDVAGDLSLAFRNVRLVSPGLSMTADGSYSNVGVLRMTAAGTSRDYGPVRLSIAGPATTPTIDAVLARPGLGIGLVDLTARIAPAPGGWRFSGNGGSNFGPVGGEGLVRTATNPVTIDVTRAEIAGMTGQGSIAQTRAGPFAGAINFTGRGLTGVARLESIAGVQHADVNATADSAVVPLATPVTIDSGQIALQVRLPAGGPEAKGSFTLTGVDRDGIRIDKAEGSLSYADGHGSARLSASGETAIPFALTADASLAPDQITINARGTIDRRAISLSGPAELHREKDGWRLAPVSVVTPEGRMQISGLYGDHSALKAEFDKVSLSLLTIAYPSFDVSGRISGNLDVALSAAGIPTGTASLRINSLSRAGLATSSAPIDIAVNAALGESGTIARAVIVRGGKVEGRAQAKIGPIPAGNTSLRERLFASPVFAQLRYNGPAQALWGLSGYEAIDVRGPLAIAADVTGILGNPTIAGTARAEGGRVESIALGAVFDQVSVDSRFTASRLELVRFSARAGKDGLVVGTGGIDLSPERGFPLDVRLRLKNAELAKRDDFSGTATGTVRIATDAYGGVISGKLAIDKARYQIGRTSVADVPVLAVTEKNTKVLGRRVATYAPPTRWLLNLQIDADRRIFVSGMGLESEWRANVKVRGGAFTPELTGRVELQRGEYDFAGKRFTLTRGDIRFQGSYPPDPIIDIAAESSANGFTATLAITGTAQLPNVRFSSVPALPEDEVLSRLLFGTSVTNLSAPEAIQLAGALASLRGGKGGFNPIGSVRKGLGIDRLRVMPVETANGRKTAVAAGQYIGRSVYVELATDAQGYTATNIEISLTRSLSILSQVATFGGTSANLRWKRDY